MNLFYSFTDSSNSFFLIIFLLRNNYIELNKYKYFTKENILLFNSDISLNYLMVTWFVWQNIFLYL